MHSAMIKVVALVQLNDRSNEVYFRMSFKLDGED